MNVNEENNRRDLVEQLCRLFGFDMSVLEGFSLAQLREAARVSLKNLAIQRGDEPSVPAELAAIGFAPQRDPDEMDASEKSQKAAAYYDRPENREALLALGVHKQPFISAYSEAPAKAVRRLR